MARYSGVVGYGIPTETAPGVWADVAHEYVYYGDVIRETLRQVPGERLNDNVAVTNSISILPDDMAIQYFALIKYVEWAGVFWTVTSVEFRHPRLILNMGEVYNGPRPAADTP